MLDKIHATGARLLKIRKKLAARDGVPGYEKNCGALRVEIARLEISTIPSQSDTTSNGERSEPATSDNMSQPVASRSGER